MRTGANIVSLTALVALVGCGGPLTPEDVIGQLNAAAGGSTAFDPGQDPGQHPGQDPGQNPTQGVGGSGPGQTIPVGGSTQGGSAGGTSLQGCATNLITAMNESGWFGGDPATAADNPCGLQGVAYAFSDPGLDQLPGTGDDTLQDPPAVPGTPEQRQSPCKDGKCCISGKTSLWPIVNGEYDYSSVWGAGIGFSLNDPGTGEPTLPYKGPAAGFVIRLSGKLTGQLVRIAFTQAYYDESAPFVATTTLGEKEVMFTDPACPTWSATCIDPGEYPHDLQIFVVGGDNAGDYQICVDSIVPIPILI